MQTNKQSINQLYHGWMIQNFPTQSKCLTEEMNELFAHLKNDLSNQMLVRKQRVPKIYMRNVANSLKRGHGVDVRRKQRLEDFVCIHANVLKRRLIYFYFYFYLFGGWERC
jgi:hypothetical protein